MRQFHKMVKHTQTICRQIADELFQCVWPFVGLALKGLNSYLANWWCNKLDDLIYICLKFYHSLSPSLGFESTGPRPTLSKRLWLLWYEVYQELHNGVGSHCPAQPSPSIEFKPRTFESHCVNIPIWKIKYIIHEK